MKKTIAVAAVTASLAVGGLAGSVLGVPGVAGAASTASSAAGWVGDALSGLVDDGTITQEQADAVEEALAEARPERGPLQHLRDGLTTVAEELGMTVDELRTALQDGQTIAQVAEAEGVELQTLVDALVASQLERLDQAVADGRLTQAQADQIAAGAEERITAMLNGDGRGFRGPLGQRQGPGFGGPEAHDEADGDTDDATEADGDPEAEAEGSSTAA